MKIYRHRKLFGLKAASDPMFAQIKESSPLSGLLELAAATGNDRVYLCGSLDQMSREYVEEPLARRWEFAREYVHKYRSPVFKNPFNFDPKKQSISIKLIGESWFPGCDDLAIAGAAWKSLKVEWEQTTKLPLLSTPSKTGQALLWESFPKNQDFLSLPDDLANHIRSISPQHRIEQFISGWGDKELFEYDGRWMYAALAGLDRLPVGEPEEVGAGEFQPFQPGWYYVDVVIPYGWNHIGLLPRLSEDEGGWNYPHRQQSGFTTWASEPELTLAQSVGWRIKVVKGWRFAKGRPLRNWAEKLIKMRTELQRRALLPEEFGCDRANHFAASAIREILNHTIGSFHAGGYERERFINDADWPEWRRKNPHLISRINRGWEKVEGGRMVSEIVPDESALSITMPHWSAQIWALERARVAQWALKCKPETLIRINGDAIYSTEELPFEDNQNLGQLRRKGA